MSYLGADGVTVRRLVSMAMVDAKVDDETVVALAEPLAESLIRVLRQFDFAIHAQSMCIKPRWPPHGTQAGRELTPEEQTGHEVQGL